MNRRIKTLMAACVAAILSVSVAAQEHATGISLKAVVVDDDIPAAAVKNIETKLQRALASNGMVTWIIRNVSCWLRKSM